MDIHEFKTQLKELGCEETMDSEDKAKVLIKWAFYIIFFGCFSVCVWEVGDMYQNKIEKDMQITVSQEEIEKAKLLHDTLELYTEYQKENHKTIMELSSKK